MWYLLGAMVIGAVVGFILCAAVVVGKEADDSHVQKRHTDPNPGGLLSGITNRLRIRRTK